MRRALCGLAAASVALVGCGSAARLSRPAATPSSAPRPASEVTRTVWYRGVGLSVPAGWPVIDGAHFRLGCSSAFEGQADRVFLGPTYQGGPSCPAQGPNWTPPPADGVWMQAEAAPPAGETPTTLPGGQVLELATAASRSAVSLWFHGVSVEIGTGADPGLGTRILDSITYRPDATDTPVLGRCPPPDPTPPPMPAPDRVTAALALPGHDAQLLPEPPGVRPTVGPASVWANLFHDFRGGFAGPLRWGIHFGSYSASTPATMNPDGSTTPQYQGVPTWLIEGTGVGTAFGPCGITVVAPYNAVTGQPMGLETIG